MQVCQDLIKASLQHDWKSAHEQVSLGHEASVALNWRRTVQQTMDRDYLQGKTLFLQKKECCAGALEGRLIATLCRLTGAKTVLEVGMFTGTTAMAVADAIPDDGKACHSTTGQECRNTASAFVLQGWSLRYCTADVVGGSSRCSEGGVHQHRGADHHSCLQVYALDIEDYMREFTTPFLTRAGLNNKVRRTLINVHCTHPCAQVLASHCLYTASLLHAKPNMSGEGNSRISCNSLPGRLPRQPHSLS